MEPTSESPCSLVVEAEEAGPAPKQAKMRDGNYSSEEHVHVGKCITEYGLLRQSATFMPTED